MQLKNLISSLTKPRCIMILGRRGSGKDATAHEIARVIHAETGKPVMVDMNPDKYNLPTYFKEAKSDFQNKTIYMLSDAHLTLYARDWGTDYNKTIDKLMTISRHKDIDMILTTQESSRLDRNVITGMDAVIFKEPSLLASEFERPEMRKLAEEATQVFQGKSQKEKWQIAYAITQTGRHTITGLKLPYYWSPELSKRYGSVEWSTRPKEQGQVLKIGFAG